MITDVKDDIVYKEGDAIDVPIFAVDGRGNINVNMDEPREIYIRPMSRKKDIPETEFLYEYLDVNGTDVIPLYEPETDKVGNILMDSTTGREKLRTVFDREANTHIIKKFQLIIDPFNVKKINLPEDNWLLRHLLECPRNASVDFIKGQPTTASSKEFFIYDPYYENKRKSESRRLVKRAYDHSRALDSVEQLRVIHAILFGEKGYQKLPQLDLQFAIESFAKEKPQAYVDLIIDNPNFELQALVQVALLDRLIRINNTGEWVMSIDNGTRSVPLGLSEMASILFLRDNPQFRNILVKDTGFDGYLKEIQNKSAKSGTIETIKAKQDALEEQNRLLMEQNMKLMEQLSSVSKNSTSVGIALNTPTPKNIQEKTQKLPVKGRKPSNKQKTKTEPVLI